MRGKVAKTFRRILTLKTYPTKEYTVNKQGERRLTGMHKFYKDLKRNCTRGITNERD